MSTSVMETLFAKARQFNRRMVLPETDDDRILLAASKAKNMGIIQPVLLGDPEELEYLGLRDYLEPGVVWLVEWPERGVGHLPRPDLRVTIEYRGTGRRLELTAETATGRRLLDQISMQA